MGKYSISRKPFKLDERTTPPPVEVLEVPLADQARCEQLPWAELARLATARTVTWGTRATPGMVWFRQGRAQDGHLQGRALLYARGR